MFILTGEGRERASEYWAKKQQRHIEKRYDQQINRYCQLIVKQNDIYDIEFIIVRRWYRVCEGIRCDKEEFRSGKRSEKSRCKIPKQ